MQSVVTILNKEFWKEKKFFEREFFRAGFFGNKKSPPNGGRRLMIFLI